MSDECENNIRKSLNYWQTEGGMQHLLDIINDYYYFYKDGSIKKREEENAIPDPDLMTWKGFKFPMGFYCVVSEDGRVKIGKCDPITKEIIVSHEI